MKKYKIFIMATVTALIFSACNNNKKADNAESTSNQIITTPDDNPTITDTANADMNKSGDATAGKNVIFTCPMHPEVRSDKPGKCPKCGMTLVIKK